MLSPDQSNAVKTMKNGGNVFLTGGAGTGKSFVISHFQSSVTDRNIAFIAPTGIAALNISGVTIHRFFKLPIGYLEPGSSPTREVPEKLRSVLKNVETIVIDEISMVRADLFQAIDSKMKAATEKDLPFGGVQMILVGDLFQLPPVTKKDETMYFDKTFGGPYFFCSDAYKSGSFSMIALTETFRQKDDKSFIKALNSIRIGETDSLDYINKRASQPAPKDRIILCTTNKSVDSVNAYELKKNKNKEYRYTASISGDFPKSDYPTNETLVLKQGCRVMSVCNFKNDDEVIANGEVGTIVHLDDYSIKVDFDERSRPVNIELNEWEIEEYVLNEETKKLEKKQLGSFRQFPLRLAWGVTIHKSQGKTLNNALLDLGRGAFAHGQLYVGLSRVRSLDNLFLKNKISSDDVIVDKRVIDFYMNSASANNFVKITESNTVTSIKNEKASTEKITKSKSKKRKKGSGGERAGAGRKPFFWPKGTELKTMRFPVELEDDLREYAQELIKKKYGWVPPS